MMVFEESEEVDKSLKQYEIRLNVQIMEVQELKYYLGFILCKPGSMEGETREIKVLGGMKVLSCREMGMNVKRRLYEGVAVSTALYWAETWSMAIAEKKRMNVMQMRCLRNTSGVLQMDRVINEEMQRRTML